MSASVQLKPAPPLASGRRVLIVDDDVDFAGSTAALLELEAIEVEFAHDLGSALRAQERFTPDVVLLDVRLGRESGINLLHALRERVPGVVCVMVTAHASADTAIDALQMGAYDYLCKPFRFGDLLAVLSRCFENVDLERRRLDAEAALTESEARFRLLIEGSIQGIVIHRDWRPLFVNTAYARLHGFESPEELLQAGHLSDRVAPHDLERLSRYALTRLRGGAPPVCYEYDAVRKDGSIATIENVVQVVQWMGEPAIQSTTVDITERKRAEQALRESEARFKDFAETAADWFWETDAELRFTYLSERYETLTGIPLTEVRGRTPAELLARHGVDVADYSQHFADLEARRPFQDVVVEVQGPGDQPAVHSLSGKPVTNEAGEFIGYRGSGTDVTEAFHLSRQLNYNASHDSLTGLVNRREFEKRLERVLQTARESGAEHALCYLDLDQFKIINDTSGHVAGDELLRQLGTMFKSVVRKRDTIARLGGDEFGVLVEHCTLDQARRVANVLRKTVDEFRFTWRDKTFAVGVSIGLVPITRGSESVTEIFKEADTACYVAKEQGRNRIHVYRPDDRELARRHGEMQWVNRITEALEGGSFKLFYQRMLPISLDAPADASCELLARMHGPDGSLALPATFLSAAERYNVASRLDRWVVESAVEWLYEVADCPGAPDTCFVNLSGQSLGDRQFFQFVSRCLDSRRSIASRLCFEITETAAIANFSAAVAFIRRLKSWGCRFALDDFGSGLSSFAYLKNLPVDYLKIDGAFVTGLDEDPIDVAMVRSINEIGHLMGMATIAECVERESVIDQLRAIGVDYAQGYVIHEPESIDRHTASTLPG